MTTRTHRRAVARFVVAAALLGSPAAVRATVTEPSGLQVPQPQSPAEATAAAGLNVLFPLMTLDALFQARGEAINWQADAQSKPDTFSPVCSFTAQLVLRGGSCQIDFGWYNVVPNHVPLDAEIFPLITAAQIAALPLPAFEPGAGESLPGLTFSAGSILTSPRYTGGLIGFATRGTPGTVCTQTHYSQQDLNLACTTCNAADNHWIASVIYKSVVDPNGYYLGFEDLPMSTTSFAGNGPQSNDGDMNDFVFFVTGVTCPGGGRPCDTGMQGFCREGVQECQTGGAIICRPSFGPMPEVCDAIDNDCNGQVDDGDHLCDRGFVCYRGRCVGPCGDTEFPCTGGLVCVNDVCVDRACAEVVCPDGQTCHSQMGVDGPMGVCAGPCDGVKCPIGQECHIGRCVDPCAGVTCAADRVCQNGACVPKCLCLACDVDFACQESTGKCVSKGCETQNCRTGDICVNGACIDGCQGVVCPSGQQCVLAQCVDGPPQTTTGGGGGGAGGGSAGRGGAGGGRGGAGGAANPDAGSGDGGGIVRRTPPSCRCEMQPGETGVKPMMMCMAVVGLILARRRRGGRR
jgi:hypothetical protein